MSCKDSKLWETISRKIFVILFECDHTFFIGATVSELRKVYCEHSTGRVRLTQSAFSACQKHGCPPLLYLVDTVIGTSADAFDRKLVWARFLKNHGYTSINGDNFNQILNRFEPEESPLYQSLMHQSFEETFAPGKALFPKPKASKPASAPHSKRRIGVSLSEQEYLAYKHYSEQHGVSLSEMARECLRLGGTFTIDLSSLMQYVQGVENCQKLLYNTLSFYLLSGAHLPSGAKELRALCDEIAQSNAEVKRRLVLLCKNLQQLIHGDQPTVDPLL